MLEGTTRLTEGDTRYRGVKGWLLLLCFSLTVLDPSAILLNLFYITNTAKPYFEGHPELFKMILITGVCRIALMVFSIYAGLSLWKVHPGAVPTAVRYFRAVFFYSVFVLFLPVLVGVSQETYRDMTATNLANSVVTVCYVALWYFYLIKSKRVRATYTE